MTKRPRQDPASVAFADRVRALLSTHGHSIVGASEPPTDVSIDIVSTAAIADCVFSDFRKKLVVKQVNDDNRIKTADEVCRIQNSIASINEALSSHLPRLWTTNHDKGVLILEFMPGNSLDSLLSIRARKQASDNGDTARQALAGVARSMADMHQIRNDRVNIEIKTRPNKAFVPRFEKQWEKVLFPALLPSKYRQSRSLLERLPDGFENRDPDSVMLIDVQPKNIIVDESKAVHFIDPDYMAGLPTI